MENILCDLHIPTRSNQTWFESGMDCFSACNDRSHYQSYPHLVTYNYNSRGFRDTEWPVSLNESIWCIGDSFTVGLGAPYNHTWPAILAHSTKQRTINVSMDGASNNWIARQTAKIIKEVAPKNIVILWSYVERRELDINLAIEIEWQKFYNDVKDCTWPKCSSKSFASLPNIIKQEIVTQHSTGPYFYIENDQVVSRDCISELRTIQRPDLSDFDHLQNFVECQSLLGNTSVIQSFIPEFAASTEQLKYISVCKGKVIPPVTILDRSRDGHHFDLLTGQQLVKQIIPLLV